jgi:hypothetical protein
MTDDVPAGVMVPPLPFTDAVMEYIVAGGIDVVEVDVDDEVIITDVVDVVVVDVVGGMDVVDVDEGKTDVVEEVVIMEVVDVVGGIDVVADITMLTSFEYSL